MWLKTLKLPINVAYGLTVTRRLLNRRPRASDGRQQVTDVTSDVWPVTGQKVSL